MRKEALEQVLRGEATVTRRGDSRVAQLADGTFAELSVEGTDQLFTILTDFGDQVDPRTGGGPGPVHNEIAMPNRRLDNTTYWEPNFDRQHYLDLFFADDGESMADFYREQSQGRYDLDGDVSEWVTLPYNGPRYGSNDIPASDGYWNWVKDSAEAWYDDQIARGRTREEIREYLATFDQWDRYDHNGDGNFDQPDGYIDHVQIVHADEGEEAGGGVLGPDAIWSHRWYAFPSGTSGPEFNPRGGVPIGDSGFWIGDYTAEPENGGLGVFAHEYGHDLGLPDLYDTSGQGDNGTGFWTVMSSGSWLSHGPTAIGTTPNYMGAWEKLQLGWLDYEVASPDGDTIIELGPAAVQEGRPQAAVVPLPKEELVTEYNEPYSGSYQWWSGAGNNLTSTLRRSIDLTDATTASIEAKTWYDIEEDYDFLHIEASTNGRSWTEVTEPITGTTDGSWQDLVVDLTSFAGEQIDLRFRYATDSSVSEAGAMLDDIGIIVDGELVFFDDVEAAGRGWDGTWERFTGTTTELVGQYYLAENRAYVGYDSTLRTGPYHFNRAVSRPGSWVQRYPYQDGLLVQFWDESQSNNQTNVHPGQGLVLPIDARPEPIAFDNGQLANGRAHSYDATFGLRPSSSLTLSNEVRVGNRIQVILAHVPSQPAVSYFDDSDPERYWDPSIGQYSVKVAGYGVRIEVLDQSDDGRDMTIRVAPSPEQP